MLINPNLSGQLARDIQRENVARAERLRPARRLDQATRPVAAPKRRVRRLVCGATARLRRHTLPGLRAGLPLGTEQVHDA